MTPNVTCTALKANSRLLMAICTPRTSQMPMCTAATVRIVLVAARVVRRRHATTASAAAPTRQMADNTYAMA